MKIKINKKLVLFTSILILLPSLVGCVFWNQLPEEIPTHFNLLGQADGYNHKMSAIFGLPTLMLLMHWLLLFIMIKDPKSSNISSKIQVYRKCRQTQGRASARQERLQAYKARSLR